MPSATNTSGNVSEPQWNSPITMTKRRSSAMPKADRSADPMIFGHMRKAYGRRVMMAPASVRRNSTMPPMGWGEYSTVVGTSSIDGNYMLVGASSGGFA